MPHLQVDINQSLTLEQKRAVAARMKQLFSEVMDTGTDHIAVSIREHGTYNLDIGRARDHEKGITLINADIREGRSMAQRRDLAVGFIDVFDELLDTPREQVYVTLTEHKGEDFHLAEGYLRSWSEGEEPLG
jgi:phenylpyruvate tautomerase PptA (4-oxalocrotonate tautomerase family)